MEISYTIKGITLNKNELADIDEYYEAACTAEYIIENHGLDEEKAMQAGYDVRRLMRKYDYTEEDAISEVLAEMENNEEDDEDEDEDDE